MTRSLLLGLTLAGAFALGGCRDKEIYQSSAQGLGETFRGVIEPGFYDGPSGTVLVGNNANGQSFSVDIVGDDGAPLRCTAVVVDLDPAATSFEVVSTSKKAPCSFSVETSSDGFTLEGSIGGSKVSHAASYERRDPDELTRTFSGEGGSITIASIEEHGLRLDATLKNVELGTVDALMVQVPAAADGEITLSYFGSSNGCHLWVTPRRKNDKVSLAVNVIGDCPARGAYTLE